MKEQAQELIGLGNCQEISYGRGMLKVIEEVMRIIESDGEQLTDRECMYKIYELINRKQQ